MCLNPKCGFPCGKCVECLQRQRFAWSIRLQYHLKDCELKNLSCWFATLTYDDNHLPLTDECKPTLSKVDIQLFMKRFRRYLDYKYHFQGVSFFVCGEYGPETLRPHYHIQIFGLSSNVNFVELINKSWLNGQIRYPHRLLPEQCHYSTKYMICEDFLPSWECQHPFRLMSKGLCKCLTDYSKDFINRFYSGVSPEDVFELACLIPEKDWDLLEYRFKRLLIDDDIRQKCKFFNWSIYDEVLKCCNDYIVHNGRKFSLPRYVRDKVFPKEVKRFLNFENSLKQRDRYNDYYRKFSDYDFEQLINGEKTMWQQIDENKKLRLKQFYNKKYKKSKSKNLLR